MGHLQENSKGFYKMGKSVKHPRRKWDQPFLHCGQKMYMEESEPPGDELDLISVEAYSLMSAVGFLGKPEKYFL